MNETPIVALLAFATLLEFTIFLLPLFRKSEYKNTQKRNYKPPI